MRGAHPPVPLPWMELWLGKEAGSSDVRVDGPSVLRILAVAAKEETGFGAIPRLVDDDLEGEVIFGRFGKNETKTNILHP